MRDCILEITENTEIAPSFFRMTLLGGHGNIRPGQFINIMIDGFYLRRPISVCDFDDETVTVIYKVVGRGTQALSENADTAALDAFPDRSKVASWAQSALAQMVKKGIITGSNGRLNPTGNVRRAEVAKMLYAISEQS